MGTANKGLAAKSGCAESSALTAVQSVSEDAKPGHIDLKPDALVLDISRRWRRTVMQVTPQNNFDEASRAELFWLDSHNLRHVAIADKGRVSATTISAPNEWPRLIGVVEYHPEAINVLARWILSDGHYGGLSVSYDANAPSLDGGIEKWGKHFLEKIGKDR
jgi:hypothetical protein